MATAKDKKKIKVKILKGKVYIKNTFNNTIVTVTDSKGNAISSSSAGSLNFKGTRKSTPYASQIVAETAMEGALKYGLKEIDIYVKGPGFGRESAIRSLTRSGVKVNLIKDITGIPHNGCRPKKERRV